MNTDNLTVQSKWWLGSILGPPLAAAIGIAMGLASPHHDSDWVGAGFIAPLVIGLLTGCGCSIICAIISMRKKERLASFAIICGVISFGVIVFAGREFLKAR